MDQRVSAMVVVLIGGLCYIVVIVAAHLSFAPAPWLSLRWALVPAPMR